MYAPSQANPTYLVIEGLQVGEQAVGLVLRVDGVARAGGEAVGRELAGERVGGGVEELGEEVERLEGEGVAVGGEAGGGARAARGGLQEGERQAEVEVEQRLEKARLHQQRQQEGARAQRHVGA